jgi:hypothetical protein
VLAINDGDEADVIRKYFQKQKFTFQPVRQKASEISNAYKVEGFPTNYVIGPDGKVAASTEGFDEAKLRKTLERVAPKKK